MWNPTKPMTKTKETNDSCHLGVTELCKFDFFFFGAFFCFSYKTYAYKIITGLAALKLWTEPCNLQACPIQASSTTQSYTSTQITQFTKAKCISCHFHTLHHFVADIWSLAVITVFSCIDSKFHELKKDNGWAKIEAETIWREKPVWFHHHKGFLSYSTVI